MPITIPNDQQVLLTPLTDEQVLTRSVRSTDIYVNILDGNENLLGQLLGVGTDGALTWDYSAAIKGSGTLSVADVNQQINGDSISWLDVRLAIWAVIEDYSAPIPLGVWIPSVPSEQWSDTGRVWHVGLLDKLSILDEDVYVNPSTGKASTFTANAGDNVVALVTQLIQQTGEATDSITPDTTMLSYPLTWDVGTTRLTIINGLLDAGGYQSLWVDMWGQYQVTAYVPPIQRAPVYQATGAFDSTSGRGIMSAEFQVDADYGSVPNRVVAIQQGSGQTAALVSTATNTDPTSPFSYYQRGRWITHVETGVDAVNQTALDTYAVKKLNALAAVQAAIQLSHAFMPDVQVNRTLLLVNPDAGLSTTALITKTSIPLDVTAFCQTSVQEVLS